MEDVHVMEEAVKKAREDALALLTSGLQNSIGISIEDILNESNMQQASSSISNQGSVILDDLFRSLGLQSHLQRTRPASSISGELQNHGNPASPLEFDSVLQHILDYEEQENAAFVENQKSHGDAHRELWPRIHRLRKTLQSADTVFEQAKQTQSFDQTSNRSRRQCYVYDEMRLGWLVSVQSKLSAHEEDNHIAVAEAPSSESVLEHLDGDIHEDAPPEIGPAQVADMIGRLKMLSTRSSGIPQNIGWRFSTDSALPSHRNTRNFIDNRNLESVSEETKNVTAEKAEPIDTSLPVNKELLVDQHSPDKHLDKENTLKKPTHAKVDSLDALNPSTFRYRLFPPSLVAQFEQHVAQLDDSSPPENIRTTNTELKESPVIDPPYEKPIPDAVLEETHIEKATLVKEEDLKPSKRSQKNRQWFRNIFRPK